MTRQYTEDETYEMAAEPPLWGGARQHTEDEIYEMATELHGLGHGEGTEYEQFRDLLRARWGGDYSDELFADACILVAEQDAEDVQ